MSDEWHNFEVFLKDMGERPNGMSLDRIDVSRGYSLENCRWATRQQQARNTTKNLRAIFDGIERTCAEIAVMVGLSDETIRRWIHSGMTDAEMKSAIPSALKRRQSALAK